MAGLISKLFSSPIFTWWNSATIGTLLFTSRKGVKVGEDDQGNVYYKEKDGRKRWVIYKNGPVEASRISADWHGWLHYTMKDAPSEKPLVKKAWEKEHQPNKTGSAEAYLPAGAFGVVGERAATTSDYEAWKP